MLISSNAQRKEANCAGIYREMQDEGATDNIYTTITPADFSDFSSLTTAISKRRAAYGRELELQRANDALCRQFAGVAEPFSKWIVEQKEAITTNKDTLENQLAKIESRIASVNVDEEKLVPIKAKSEEIENSQITNKLHTSLIYKDLEAQWNQYKVFLERKKNMLNEKIENIKLRGLTAEKLQEIKDNFVLFDTSKDGSIDRKELKACLYSLGEEKGSAEIDDIIKKYGRAKEQDITYEGFREFMILIYGDSDTRDEIVGAFALISKGQELAKKETIELVMPESDVEYFTSTAPNTNGAYDYKKWLEVIFAR